MNGDDTEAMDCNPLFQRYVIMSCVPVELESENTTQTPEEIKSEWTGTYTWRVENWTQLKDKKVYSPEFEIGSYSWRLLVFPRGNDSQRMSDYIAVYLDFPEAPFTPPQMCPKAKFELMAVKKNDPYESLKREATHLFTNQATDWGFTQFLPLQEAQNPRNGYLVDDALTFSVSISVEKDDHLYRMSRKETGFVGLKNQGATCYMNSLLQYLFHIGSFRKAVYHMPILESDDPEKSIPLALQSLFYKLQYQNSSVNTKDLTKSFGWGTYDAFLQHDIQEMQVILCEKLEEKMKGTKVEACIPELFAGHYSNYIDCESVDYTSTCKQAYKEIQLDILGCKDIYESLEKFCEVERLEGANRYKAENHGLVDAKRYALFDSFPSVLQLHLKRFDYDPIRNVMIKINSRYEFYDELDLDYNNHALLSKNADKTVENKYKLHSVLVHSGGPHGGHYFAFIRSGDKWYKFDDELVKEELPEKAINEQFGDEDGTTSANFAHGLKYAKQSTAYMLVYIRISDWDRIMCDAGKEDISEPIRKRLEAEQLEKERRQKEKKEAHLYVVIKLACEKHFAEQLGESYYFDLANFDAVKNYRIQKKTPFEDFQQMVSKDFGVPKHFQRFWLWIYRTNNTMRVSKPLNEIGSELKTVLDLRHYKEKTLNHFPEKNALMTIKLFLESPSESALNGGMAGGALRAIPKNELIIFMKYYDPVCRKLSYLGHMFVEKNCPFRLIFERAKKMAGLKTEEDVICFEEVKHSPTVVCTELPPEATPEKSQLIQGDILIIQKVSGSSQHEFKTVKSFLEFIQNSKTVNFKSLKHIKDEGFKLDLLKTMTYEQVTHELAKHLQVEDPKTLRLTQHNIYAHMPHRSPIKYNGIETLEQMIMHARQYTNILYYEILDMPLPILETLKCLTIGFHNAKGEWQSEHQLRMSKDKKVSDLLNALKEELGPKYIHCDMRIMEILSSKVFKILDPEGVLEQLYESYWIFRAEVIPEDQKNLKSDEFLVVFCHCKPDDNCMTVFGDPLWVKVKKGETVGEVKIRIQKTLEINDEDFSQWKFAYHARPMYPVDYLKDEDEILTKFSRIALSGRTNGKFIGDNTSFMALLHEDTKPNRRTPHHSRYYNSEKGVKIYTT
eukprot:g6471.t1